MALQHESYCRIVETMLCFNQLDISNLAFAELVARQLQLLEKTRVASGHFESAAAEEHTLFMGSSAGHGATFVSPALKTWIATEMARGAAILKERRKA